jgi:hypothetical protein
MGAVSPYDSEEDDSDEAWDDDSDGAPVPGGRLQRLRSSVIAFIGKITRRLRRPWSSPRL